MLPLKPFALRLCSALLLAAALLLTSAFRPVEVTPERPALGGYDPVAYFLEGKAVRGHLYYEARYAGHLWRFSCRTHRKVFLAAPEKFLPLLVPAGGGGMARVEKGGELPAVDPERFVVYGGQLFVFADRGALRWWQQDGRAQWTRGDFSRNGHAAMALAE